MIWSLIKILSFVVLVAGLAFGAGIWMESGEGFRLQVSGWEINPGPLQAVVLLVLLFLAVWFVIRLSGLLVATFRFLSGDETAISRYFDRNRERKGYEALADGMLALASGDGRLALAKSAKAERFLQRPELTDLLSAQAAEMSGDRTKAQDVYKRLLSNDRTRFVGIRGLLQQKLDDGDSEVALELARKAFGLNPRHEETQDVLLSLQAEQEDWSGARDTIRTKLRHGNLPKDVHRRRDAVLALSEARDILDDGDGIEAQEAAIEANRLSPDLVPAAVMAARAYIAQDKPKYAARVIRKAWAAAPHPDLAATYAEIAPDESPAERLKRFAGLFKDHPDHADSRMLEAELLISADDFPGARKIMGNLVEEVPTARALTIMAAIERGEGARDSIVRGFLAKAVNAPRGPAWVCDRCSTTHDDWSPTCIRCGALDTLSWRTAPQGDRAMPGSTEMLPLIVGAEVSEPVEEDDFDGVVIVDAPSDFEDSDDKNES